MSEPVAFRFRYPDGEENTHVKVTDWPPPERFDFPDGSYVKVSQSELPEGLSAHVMRGAVYEWQPV